MLSPGMSTALAIYLGMAILSFTVSAAYHLLPWDDVRPLFHRLDHAAIYLKIAGTYTPLVLLIGSVFAYVLLSLVWIVALGGAIAKLTVWKSHGRRSLLLYLALGWGGVLLAWPLWHTLPGPAMYFILAGGAIYTAGTVVYARKSLRYQYAIWHGFVLGASACFFAGIALGVTA